MRHTLIVKDTLHCICTETERGAEQEQERRHRKQLAEGKHAKDYNRGAICTSFYEIPFGMAEHPVLSS